MVRFRLARFSRRLTCVDALPVGAAPVTVVSTVRAAW